jgi:3-hydroxyacyl-CoA dehydrogenase/enoyl-CoA hydratase/3-hydroxybutyryl-CoA epimerase
MLQPGASPPQRLAALVVGKNLGRKTGRGFYAWPGGRVQKQSPGTVPAGLAERLIRPMVAEAQATLAEGIVADADLVDAGAIFGTGFAPFRGGPLHYAAQSARASAATTPEGSPHSTPGPRQDPAPGP